MNFLLGGLKSPFQLGLVGNILGDLEVDLIELASEGLYLEKERLVLLNELVQLELEVVDLGVVDD